MHESPNRKCGNEAVQEHFELRPSGVDLRKKGEGFSHRQCCDLHAACIFICWAHCVCTMEGVGVDDACLSCILEVQGGVSAPPKQAALRRKTT
jgi:hypothetical protein